MGVFNLNSPAPIRNNKLQQIAEIARYLVWSIAKNDTPNGVKTESFKKKGNFLNSILINLIYQIVKI